MAFCSNCGTKIEEGAHFCFNCGKTVNSVPNEPAAPVEQQSAVIQTQSIKADEKYCFSCGSVIKKAAEICPQCGVNQNKRNSATERISGKNWLVALMLCLFTSVGHRFYVGKIGTGIIRTLILVFYFIFYVSFTLDDEDYVSLFFSAILFIANFIWFIVDLVSLCTGNFRDSQGKPLKNN